MADEAKGAEGDGGKREESKQTPSEYRLKVNQVIKGMPSEVFAVKFSYDSKYIASGLGDGSIRVLNQSTGHTHVLGMGRVGHMPVTSLRFRPVTTASKTKNVLLAVDADGVAKHWHVTSGKCLHTITAEGDNQLFAVDYRTDGTMFATAGSDKHIRIYDEATKSLVQSMTGGIPHVTVGHSNRVFSLKFVPDSSNILVSGGWDSTVQVWDTRVGHSVRSIFGPFVAGDAVDVHGDVILTGSNRPENALQTWSLGSCKLIEDIPWNADGSKRDRSMLYAAQFSRDGKLIAAGGYNVNMAKVFDRSCGNSIVGTLAGLSRGVFSVDWADGHKVAIAGGDAAVRLFDVVGGEGERTLTLEHHDVAKGGDDESKK